MLTLSLLRHAKSSWEDAELEDHERPLSRRGARDAPRMGRFMAAEGLAPDLVLCSGAVRTRATLTLLLAEFARETEGGSGAGRAGPDVQFDDALYLATPTTMLERVRKVRPGVGTLLVVGHNPGIHALALELTGSGRRRDIALLAMGFPTCALAVIDFELGRFSEVRPALGNLRSFVTPRQLD